MKRKLCVLLCAALALCLLAAGIAEGFDFTGMTLDELYSVRDALNARIRTRLHRIPPSNRHSLAALLTSSDMDSKRPSMNASS